MVMSDTTDTLVKMVPVVVATGLVAKTAQLADRPRVRVVKVKAKPQKMPRRRARPKMRMPKTRAPRARSHTVTRRRR